MQEFSTFLEIPTMFKEIFLLINTLVFILWLIMMIAPYSHFTKRFFNSIWLWIFGGFIYLSLIFAYGSGIDWASVARPNYEGITSLFSQAEVAAIAWIHLILFDLFAGRWILMDLNKRTHRKFIHIPFLFLTLMAGPFGMATYLIFRRIVLNKNSMDAS
jgi:hypothetical protein